MRSDEGRGIEEFGGATLPWVASQKVRRNFSAREMELDGGACEQLRGKYHRSTRPPPTPWFNAAPGKRPITRAATGQTDSPLAAPWKCPQRQCGPAETRRDALPCQVHSFRAKPNPYFIAAIAKIANSLSRWWNAALSPCNLGSCLDASAARTKMRTICMGLPANLPSFSALTGVRNGGSAESHKKILSKHRGAWNDFACRIGRAAILP